MEEELVHLRKELDAKFIQTRYENTSKILDGIITTQRDPSNKNGIGILKNKTKLAQNIMQLFSSQYIQEERGRKDKECSELQKIFSPHQEGIQDNSKEGLSKQVSSHFPWLLFCMLQLWTQNYEL